jgi:Ca2+-binding RTX toxin-like protein
VGVTVDLGTSADAHGSGDGFDTLISIESVVGSALADTLVGDAQANALSGGAGSDRQIGALGCDTLTGDARADVFDYDALAESASGAGNRDVITDFQKGLDDIDVSGIDANTARGGDRSFRFIGTQDFEIEIVGSCNLRRGLFAMNGRASAEPAVGHRPMALVLSLACFHRDRASYRGNSKP